MSIVEISCLWFTKLHLQIDVYTIMKKQQVSFTIPVHNTLVETFVRCDQTETVENLYNNFNSLHLPMTTETCQVSVCKPFLTKSTHCQKPSQTSKLPILARASRNSSPHYLLSNDFADYMLSCFE